MYNYDTIDRDFLARRSAQFRDQVARRLSGELSEDEFKPLRLQNGLYLQLHAYMLRVAIPYGVLSSRQLRGLASIALDFDRGFGHFTTRQNQGQWKPLILTVVLGISQRGRIFSSIGLSWLKPRIFLTGLLSWTCMPFRPLATVSEM